MARKPLLLVHEIETHPGEILAEWMKEHDALPQSVAKRARLTSTTIADVAARRASISPEIAAGLERATGISVQYWLAHQAGFDAGEAARAARRGGARKGAGRKKMAAEEKLHVVSMRVPRDVADAVKQDREGARKVLARWAGRSAKRAAAR